MDENQSAVATYNKIAEKYASQYFDDVTDLPYVDTFLKILPSAGEILDVGCGAGQFTHYMSSKGFKVTGIDLSPQMITIAKQRVPEGNFLLMDMRKLVFPTESFEGLLLAYSLIHVPSSEISQVLQAFWRVLKPGGYIEFMTQKGLPDQWMDEPFLPGEKMFFNFFTPERLNGFLTQAGFRVESQIETNLFDPDSMSDKVIYTLVQKPTI